MAERVADRLHGRPREPAGRLVRAPLRHHLGADRAGRRRRAAGVPERLPPPRQHAVPGRRRGADRAALPVPPVGVGPARRAAGGAVAPGVRRVPQRGPAAAARPGGGVGPARVRVARPAGGAARGVAGGRAGRRRVVAARRVPLRGHHPHPGAVQLEGGRRRLLGDVPRAGAAPRDARLDRRRARRAAVLGPPRGLVPALRGAESPARARRRRPGGVGLVRADPGRPHGSGPRRGQPHAAGAGGPGRARRDRASSCASTSASSAPT